MVSDLRSILLLVHYSLSGASECIDLRSDTIQENDGRTVNMILCMIPAKMAVAGIVMTQATTI